MARPHGDPLVRRGDAILYAWGEAKRNGMIEALLRGDPSSLKEEATIRAPGAYSDPVLSALLAAESLSLAVSVSVNREIEAWRRNPDTVQWADIAETFYASPYKHTEADVAEVLKIDRNEVGATRTSIRRVIAITAGVLWLGWKRKESIDVEVRKAA